jgi:hypothetical protein
MAEILDSTKRGIAESCFGSCSRESGKKETTWEEGRRWKEGLERKFEDPRVAVLTRSKKM